jgi:hypothetical protein
MRRKRLKQREKLGNFEDWEIRFMKFGPPPYEQQIKEKKGFYYLDGRHIWQRLQVEPGFDPGDYPWAKQAFRNI